MDTSDYLTQNYHEEVSAYIMKYLRVLPTLSCLVANYAVNCTMSTMINFTYDPILDF